MPPDHRSRNSRCRYGFVSTVCSPRPAAPEPTLRPTRRPGSGTTPQAGPQDKPHTSSESQNLPRPWNLPTPQATPQVATELAKVLSACRGPQPARPCRKLAGINYRAASSKKPTLEPLPPDCRTGRTIHRKPTSKTSADPLTEGWQPYHSLGSAIPEQTPKTRSNGRRTHRSSPTESIRLAQK